VDSGALRLALEYLTSAPRVMRWIPAAHWAAGH
jgi:hypothetical protein